MTKGRNRDIMVQNREEEGEDREKKREIFENISKIATNFEA